MRIPKKWAAAVGAATLACVLATGVAFAATGGKAPEAGQPSPGMQEVQKQIRSLRRSRMEQLRAEIQALIDKAQADGKITADEAARLKQGPMLSPGHHGRHGAGAKVRALLQGARTPEEVRAKLQEAVKAGTLTQKQADQILEKWKAWHSGKENR